MAHACASRAGAARAATSEHPTSAPSTPTVRLGRCATRASACARATSEARSAARRADAASTGTQLAAPLRATSTRRAPATAGRSFSRLQAQSSVYGNEKVDMNACIRGSHMCVQSDGWHVSCCDGRCSTIEYISMYVSACEHLYMYIYMSFSRLCQYFQAHNIFIFPACARTDSSTLSSLSCRCTSQGACACFDGWAGDKCDVITKGQMAITSVQWCETCQAGSRCIVNGLCGNNVPPVIDQIPNSGKGTVIVSVQHLGCYDYQTVSFSWSEITVEARVSGVSGYITTLEFAPPSAPRAGVYLMTVADAFAPITFVFPGIQLSCVGAACVAPATGGLPFTALVTNMPVLSAAELEVTIANMPVTFTLTSSTSTETRLLITPPDCSACAFTSRYAHVLCHSSTCD
jgi:hypothetical protein